VNLERLCQHAENLPRRAELEVDEHGFVDVLGLGCHYCSRPRSEHLRWLDWLGDSGHVAAIKRGLMSHLVFFKLFLQQLSVDNDESDRALAELIVDGFVEIKTGGFGYREDQDYLEATERGLRLKPVFCRNRLLS
jgi:hypothetical protein